MCSEVMWLGSVRGVCPCILSTGVVCLSRGGMAPAVAWCGSRCSVVVTAERTYGSIVRTRRHWRGRQLAAGPEGGRLYSRGGAGKILRQTLNTLRAFQLPASDRSGGSVESLVRMCEHRPALCPYTLTCTFALP